LQVKSPLFVHFSGEGASFDPIAAGGLWDENGTSLVDEAGTPGIGEILMVINGD
jgi:hypothetical protein